jgi:hypothetical protein
MYQYLLYIEFVTFFNHIMATDEKIKIVSRVKIDYDKIHDE